jgi:cell division protein ZapE
MALRPGTKDAIVLDPAQEVAAKRLDTLARALKSWRPGSWFAGKPPRGLYIWGDVGRGKSMLMDRFFERTSFAPKRRAHFNAFMVDVHARIHEWRNLDHKTRTRRAEYMREAGDDPIAPVARSLSREAALLCFDEFQVRDVADALILGRLFEQLFLNNVVIVATSNTEPERLYEGGLNRQLFVPFIRLIERRLDVVEVNGPKDYRLLRMKGQPTYLTPLGPDADRAMDAIWLTLTGSALGTPRALSFLGRTLEVPQATGEAARFDFTDLCTKPLAAPDYLEIARRFTTVFIDRIPLMGPDMRNEARRFVLLIDTLYDEGVHLVCSAAAPPEGLYVAGDGADSFRRTASRLVEMQSDTYLNRGHGNRV